MTTGRHALSGITNQSTVEVGHQELKASRVTILGFRNPRLLRYDPVQLSSKFLRCIHHTVQVLSDSRAHSKEDII